MTSTGDENETLVPTSLPTLSPTVPTVFPTLNEPTSIDDLRISFVLYATIGMISLLLFVFFRRLRYCYTRVYYPNYPHEDELINEHDMKQRTSTVVPPKRQDWCSWFLFLLKSERDQDVLNQAGLDAYLTLRLNRFATCIFAVWTPISMFILSPIYAKQRDNMAFLDQISLSNVKPEDTSVFRLMYVLMLLFCVMVLYGMKVEFEHFIKVRHKYMAMNEKVGETFTVVVERIPARLLSEDKLKSYFEVVANAPNSVTNVVLVPRNKLTGPLQKLIRKRNQVLLALEKVNAQNTRTTGKNKRNQMVTFDTKNTLEELKSLGFATKVSTEADMASKTKVEPEAENAAESATIEAEVEQLHAISKEEMKGNLTLKKKVLQWLSLLSCSLCNSICVKRKIAAVVDTENFYSEKLEVLNILISSLQERAILRVEDIESSTAAEKPAWPESSEEQLLLLDNSHTKAEVVKQEKSFFKVILRNSKHLYQSVRGKGALRKEGLPTASFMPVAFITFRSQYLANVMHKMIVSEVKDTLTTTVAQKPADMAYSNLAYSQFYKIMMGFFTVALTAVALLFFGTVVSSIAAITNLKNLRESIAALDDFLIKYEFLVIVFEQLGPILLVLMFTLVPTVLLLVIGIQKPVSVSKLHGMFFLSYYAFSVLQLFIFYQIAGSLTSILGQGLLDPIQYINILATTIPDNTVFFMQFILIKTLFVLPFDLLRVTDLILGVCLRRPIAGRPFHEEGNRERNSAKCGLLSSVQNPSDPFLARINAQSMLLHTIGITYSIISPLFSVICLSYCIVFQLVYRNQFLFLHQKKLRETDALGNSFSRILGTFRIAIILMVATMMGLFGLNQQAGLVTLCIPVFIIIWLVSIYFSKVYSAELDGLPLSLARLYKLQMENVDEKLTEDKQAANGVAGLSQDSDSASVTDYRHPVLREPAVVRDF